MMSGRVGIEQVELSERGGGRERALKCPFVEVDRLGNNILRRGTGKSEQCLKWV